MTYRTITTHPEKLDAVLNAEAEDGYALETVTHLPGGVRTVLLVVLRKDC